MDGQKEKIWELCVPAGSVPLMRGVLASLGGWTLLLRNPCEWLLHQGSAVPTPSYQPQATLGEGGVSHCIRLVGMVVSNTRELARL